MTVYALNHYQEFAGQKIMNVWWIEGTALDLQSVVDSWVSIVFPAVRAIQVNGVSNTRIGVRQEGIAAPEQNFTPTGWPLAGTVVDAGLPPHDAGLLTLYASGGAYPLSSRKYFAGVPETSHSNGIVDGTYVGLLQAVGTAVLDFNTTNAGTAAIVAYRKTDGATNDITRYVVRNQVALQGHRRMGRGQ